MTEPTPPLAPGLYVVATPIGNLEDITLRALRVLGSVDRIACEDTRQTQKLLAHFGIAKPLLSYHQHNERQRSPELLAMLHQGQRIALVSDAGLPGISDPGADVVQQAIAAGIPVVPIPGACAAVTALAAAGLDTTRFLFLGFPPPRPGERRSFFGALRTQPATMVFYEAPHRIVPALADAAAALGEGRRAVLAREVTKIYEEFLRGTLQDIHASLSQRGNVRGEITLMVAGASGQQDAPSADAEQGSILARLAELKKMENLDEMDALKRIARERGASKSAVYRELQRERSCK
ncbi:MAG: 16S rRNA (cytidine(1402)-2'-O)-methyltransferase [Acidobacteriaceae bacterium]